MNRRQLLLAAASSALLPSNPRAQDKVWRVGFLSARSPEDSAPLLEAFRAGLRETGYSEGKNVHIEYRWARGHYDRLGALASELAGSKVDVIATTGGTASALAAKNAAAGAIPVVFAAGSDPVKLGLVASLGRPGGNITGASQLTEVLEAKRLEILTELMPGVASIDVLLNRGNPTSEISVREINAAARRLKRTVAFISAATDAQIDAAFAQLAQRGSKALFVTTDPFLDTRRARVIALAAKYGLPAIYGWREHIFEGGLIGYGTAAGDAYEQVGRYVGRILGGAKPAELPVQTGKMGLFINRRTAQALRLSVPQKLLVRADEVID